MSHSLETKNKIRDKLRGNKNALGIKHTQEFKDNVRKRVLGTKVPFKERPKAKGRKVWNKGLVGVQKSPNKGKKLPERSGVNSSNWKGGITPINIQIRSSLEYKLWEDSVKNRDGNSCIRCGENRVSKLVAHHILNFSNHIEIRMAIDNGITFCRECHKIFHSIYGKKDNNREQVTEFLLK